MDRESEIIEMTASVGWQKKALEFLIQDSPNKDTVEWAKQELKKLQSITDDDLNGRNAS
jgi:hypothetical protein